MNIPRLIYLCFAVYFIWSFKQEKQQEAFRKEVFQQDSMVVEMLDERMDEIWDKAASDLNDYRKKDYRPILPAFVEIQSNFNEFSKKLDSLSKLQSSDNSKISNFQMQESFQQTIEKGYASYEQLLLNHGESPFGFKQEEIESRLENMQSYLDHHLLKNDFKCNSSTNHLSYLRSRAKLLEYHLLKEITGYYQGRVLCGGDFLLFPVVVPTKATPFIGENFEARIGIGHYASQVDPALLRYIINGDTIPANMKDGTIEIVIPATKIGAQELDVAYEIINPLTGKKVTHSLPYEYVVLSR